ncbi:MAG: AsmA-like C-terminal region-containing protein, partial [Candidatus Binatia bacterium]
MTLSGTTEATPAPRFQLRLRSDSNDLPGWGHLVSSRSFYSDGGKIDWDIVVGKNLALPDGWNIRGKLKLAGAEFKHKESGRKIDHLDADVSFLGTEALLENGSFRLGSSSMTVVAKVRDISQLQAIYRLQSPELNLVDLPGFPGGKPNQMRNVAANGEVEWQDGTPLLRATVLSSEGSLENIPYHGLRGRMTWTPAGLRFEDLSFRAFDGLLRADGSWSAPAEQPPRFIVTSEIESIAVESLIKQKFPSLQNRIEGQLDFRGRFDATPNNGLSVAAALQAVGAGVIRHGTIRDFNLMGSIIPLTGDTASSKTLPHLPDSLVTALNRQHTAFDTLKANFTVERQRIRTEDFLLITPDYTITGSGWIGFDRTTQWHGLMVLSPAITQALQQEYRMIRYLLDRRGRLTISFRAEGKFPNVKVSPENRRLAQVLGRSFSAKTMEKQEKPWLPKTLEQLLKP